MALFFSVALTSCGGDDDEPLPTEKTITTDDNAISTCRYYGIDLSLLRNRLVDYRISTSRFLQNATLRFLKDNVTFPEG